MTFCKNMSSSWGITAKLTILFGLFGLIPMAVVGLIAYTASLTIERSVGTRFQTLAEGVADRIDRNLFERYGDVQAFGFNAVLDQKAAWYRADLDGNPIREVMDQYVDTYDIYYLSILVDLDGRVIAVNSKDANGKSIRSQEIYGKNYRESAWFRALKTRQFTTSMPFSAPENTVSTGTFIEDLHVDPDVKAAYPGDDGLTLGFSAPVYRNGKVVAYWSNRAKFSLVEDILRSVHQVLKRAGFPNAIVILLDKDGKILADYDPVGRGTDQMQHDFTELMAESLVNSGVEAARGAVVGKTGFTNDPHPRTGVPQVIGYTHLKGALGYPGMNWSVLVAVDHAHATADARGINRNVLIAIVACLALIVSAGIPIGRVGVRGILQISRTATKLADGDLSARVAVATKDEVGSLAQAFNYMGMQIQEKVIKEQEGAAKMQQFVLETKEVLNKVAEGDLTSKMTGTWDGELGQIQGSINRAIDNLTAALTAVRELAESVTAGAEQLAQGNEDLAQRTNHAAASLEETSSSMEEMTSTVKQNADNAKQANQLAAAARDVANKGGAVTAKAIEAMGEINNSSKKIADIITVIDEIAFQTNLLALNAAVEAARAGEHGRGFAVVASEVRNLAQRSATAAKEIKGLINESIQRVTDGSALVDQSGRTLAEIVNSVKRVTDIIAEITAASQEQASGIEQVNKAVIDMDQTTQQNAALVEETTSASRSMKEQIQMLIRQVGSFKTHVTEKEKSGMPNVVQVRENVARSMHDIYGNMGGGAVSSLIPGFKAVDQNLNASSKPEIRDEPAAVVAGNGMERRGKEEEFEEF
jgi:methyl-accepting chemotaxis protein